MYAQRLQCYIRDVNILLLYQRTQIRFVIEVLLLYDIERRVHLIINISEFKTVCVKYYDSTLIL